MTAMLQTETERSARTSPRSGWIFAGLFTLGLGMVILLYLLPRPTALHLLDERGPMELVSLAGYALGVVCLIPMVRHRPALAGWSIATLLFLSLSEYNPANVMTKWIDKVPSDPGDPIGVNVLGVALVSLVVLGLLTGLLWSSRGLFLTGLRESVPENWLILVGGLFLSLSFLIDRIQGYYFNWHRGYRMNKGIFYASDVVEETLEFLMPFFFLFAILLWSRRRERREIAS